MDHSAHIECSFCGKGKTEVKKMVSGPNVYMCDGCILLSYDIVKSDEAAAGGMSVIDGEKADEVTLLDYLYERFGGGDLRKITIGQFFRFMIGDLTMNPQESLFFKKAAGRVKETLSADALGPGWRFSDSFSLHRFFPIDQLGAIQELALQIIAAEGEDKAKYLRISLDGVTWKRYSSFKSLLATGRTTKQAYEMADLAP